MQRVFIVTTKNEVEKMKVFNREQDAREYQSQHNAISVYPEHSYAIIYEKEVIEQ